MCLPIPPPPKLRLWVSVSQHMSKFKTNIRRHYHFVGYLPPYSLDVTADFVPVTVSCTSHNAVTPCCR